MEHDCDSRHRKQEQNMLKTRTRVIPIIAAAAVLLILCGLLHFPVLAADGPVTSAEEAAGTYSSSDGYMLEFDVSDTGNNTIEITVIPTLAYRIPIDASYDAASQGYSSGNGMNFYFTRSGDTISLRVTGFLDSGDLYFTREGASPVTSGSSSGTAQGASGTGNSGKSEAASGSSGEDSSKAADSSSGSSKKKAESESSGSGSSKSSSNSKKYKKLPAKNSSKSGTSDTAEEKSSSSKSGAESSTKNSDGNSAASSRFSTMSGVKTKRKNISSEEKTAKLDSAAEKYSDFLKTADSMGSKGAASSLQAAIDDAEKNGASVVTGTIRTMSYYDVLALQGKSDPNPGSGSAESDPYITVLICDGRQSVTAATEDGDYYTAAVQMIRVDPSAVSGYEGQHVTAAFYPGTTYWPSDTSVPLGEPRGTIHILQ